MVVRALLVLLATVAASGPAAQVARGNVWCSAGAGTAGASSSRTRPTGRIAWLADDPVWEFDVYRPANRTALNGAGLELRDVRYRGRKVLSRAGPPVLNVEYDPGAGCSCFRDWQFDEAPIDAGEADHPAPRFALAQPGGVQTFAAEASRLAAAGTFWSVVDAQTGIDYEVVPGDADLRLPADPFSKTDALVLRYKLDEIDDGRTV